MLLTGREEGEKLSWLLGAFVILEEDHVLDIGSGLGFQNPKLWRHLDSVWNVDLVQSI